MKLGFIGFGELPCCFAKGLVDKVEIVAFDINKEKALKCAEDLSNVRVVNSIEDLLLETKHIMVALPGKYDEVMFDGILDCSISHCLFMDLSTALPESKKRISSKLIARQAKYVDVAVLGSVPKLLHKTPMMISGNGAKDMLTIVSSWDMDIVICGSCAGKASTIKLCRSVFMKCLPALLIETHRICEKYGVDEEVFASIYKNLTDQSFEMYANRLIESANRHWKRQKEELEECVEIAKAVNVNPSIIYSAAGIFESLGEESNGNKKNN